jgi:hypothetical protein
VRRKKPRPKAPVKDLATEELVGKLRSVVSPPAPRNAIELLRADQANPPKVSR